MKAENKKIIVPKKKYVPKEKRLPKEDTPVTGENPEAVVQEEIEEVEQVLTPEDLETQAEIQEGVRKFLEEVVEPERSPVESEEESIQEVKEVLEESLEPSLGKEKEEKEEKNGIRLIRIVQKAPTRFRLLFEDGSTLWISKKEYELRKHCSFKKDFIL